VSRLRGHPLLIADAAAAARAIRALGGHRYVASRLILVHAFALDAAAPLAGLEGARAWAEGAVAALARGTDPRDAGWLRRSTEAEAALVLDAFWGAAGPSSRARLAARLDAMGIDVPDARPFDERVEAAMSPILIDAGWELAPLDALDPERHKGAIQAFGGDAAFASAREAARGATDLHELSAIGPVELLHGVDGAGRLVDDLVVYVAGDPTYHDYVLRGVARAAKLV